MTKRWARRASKYLHWRARRFRRKRPELIERILRCIVVDPQHQRYLRSFSPQQTRASSPSSLRL